MKKRLIRSARVLECEQPAEDTTEPLAETERIFARMLKLISAINRTNAKTAFDAKRTISDSIAERDVVGKRLKAVDQHRINANLCSAGSVVVRRLLHDSRESRA